MRTIAQYSVTYIYVPKLCLITWTQTKYAILVWTLAKHAMLIIWILTTKYFFLGWLVGGGGTGVGGFIFVGSLYIHQKDMWDTWTWYSEMYGAVVIFCDV